VGALFSGSSITVFVFNRRTNQPQKFHWRHVIERGRISLPMNLIFGARHLCRFDAQTTGNVEAA
jgi:hypothetical protein